MERAVSSRGLRVALIGMACGLVAHTTAAQTPIIGNVAAANQAVIGTPPAATQRQLQLGFDVNAQERIQTADIGAGQFLFLDQTTLSVWPNSDIVLDKYVYDPDRGVGEMSVTLTRGVLRFIGGRISKSTDAEIRTPQGLVTVRGGIAQVEVSDGLTRVVHIAGEYTRLGDLTLSRPNAAAEARSMPSGPPETRFVGVLRSDGIAALFGQPQGRGTGGLGAPPGDVLVSAGLQVSGAQQRGSDDLQAPNRPPISTLGEQPRSQEAPRSPEQPAQTDRQIVVGERLRARGEGLTTVDGTPVVPAPVVPGPVVLGPVTPAPVDPVPVDPLPVDPLPVDPLPMFPPPLGIFGNPLVTTVTGFPGLNLSVDAQSRTLGGGVVIANPAAQQVLVVGDNGTGFQPFFLQLTYTVPDSTGEANETVDFLLAQNAQTPTQQSTALVDEATALLNQGIFFALTDDFLLLPADNDTGGTFTGDVPGGAFQGALNGQPAVVELVSDGGVFTLGTFFAQNSIGLSFFGTPTPAAFWDQASTDPGAVRFTDYDVTNAFFTGVSVPLPAQLGDAFAEAVGGGNTPGLLVLSSPGGQFTGAAPRSLAGLLDFSSAGPTQSSVFGVFTGAAQRLANGQLVLSAPAFLTTRVGETPGVAAAQVQLGSIVSGEAASYGPAGEYLVLGNVQNTVVQGALVSTPLPNVYRDQVNGAQNAPILYGDTRLASSLTGQGLLPGGDRETLGGVPFGFSAASAAVTSALTGGYATNTGNSSQPDGSGGFLLSQPYRLGSFGPDSLRIGFAPSVNGVVAELSSLSDLDNAGLFGLNVNYGTLDGGDALLNDAVFGLRESQASAGPLTAQQQMASSSIGRPPVDGRQQAFVGGFASSGLAGDGGLFGPGIDRDPEFLRWGWWNGEFRFADAEQNTALAGRFDRLHLGPWVSGVVSDLADVNAVTGRAIYDGFAIANVIEQTAVGPATYVEGGRFEMVYDFAATASGGSVTLSGILGQDFSGAVSPFGTSGANHYGGSLFAAGPSTAGAGSVQGAFFTGDGDPVAATAGVFDVNGVTARGNPAAAVGVFGADALR